MKESRARLIAQGDRTALEGGTATLEYKELAVTATQALSFARTGCSRVQIIVSTMEGSATLDALAMVIREMEENNEQVHFQWSPIAAPIRMLTIWRTPLNALSGLTRTEDVLLSSIEAHGRNLNVAGALLVGDLLELVVETRPVLFIAHWTELCDSIARSLMLTRDEAFTLETIRARVLEKLESKQKELESRRSDKGR